MPHTRSWSRAATLATLVAAATLGGADAPAQESGGGPARGFAPGLQHPDLWLRDLDGTLRRFSEFSGRKLFVFHFASW